MRETWARRIAMLTGGLVVVLAIVFAFHQNPPRPIPVAVSPPAVEPAAPPMPQVKPAPPAISPSLIEAGQQVYAEQACARCHSIAGRGGARGPLDDVGARLSEAELRAWVTPSTETKGFQARHANIDLTPAQRDALVTYLRSLR